MSYKFQMYIEGGHHMKHRYLPLFLTVLLICIFALAAGPLWAAGPKEAPAAAGKAKPESLGPTGDYVIGPGDVLDIAVWKDEALTKSVVVRPDGKISFPLVGEIAAGGMTTAELKKELETRLARYVPDVDLFVNVAQINSMIVYVIGKVNSPGRLVLNAPINVLQVLATAGGMNTYAKRNSIRIFRQEGLKTRIFYFNYDDVSEGKNVEKNILLQRGDVIVIP